MKKLIYAFTILFLSKAYSETHVSLLGITLHGTEVSNRTSRNMKNKISSGGGLVYNYQLNVTKITENQWMFQAAAINDCFGNAAYLTTLGRRYQVTEKLYLGWEVGFYARKMHSNVEDMPFSFKKDGYEYLPSPAAFVSYNLTNRIVFRAQTNGVLNFADFAFSFK